MAYRFLLEVPKTMADDANAAIAAAGNAQVLVSRPSHGLGIDDEYRDLTVAAQDLTVVEELYGWLRDVQANRPESRTAITIVLHDGRRVGLHGSDPAQTIAAIRRDQPWVERTIPKIGEHERERFAPARREAVAVAEAAIAEIGHAIAAESGETDPASRIDDVTVHLSEGTIDERGEVFHVIRVMDLAGPEHFYHDVLGMQLLGRTRKNAEGRYVELPPDYDHATAAQVNAEADVAFMAHGPVKIALQRVGRAIVLDYSRIVNDFTLTVEPALANRIKAQVMMRGYTLLEETPRSFTLRDPYAVAWEIVPSATRERERIVAFEPIEEQS